MQHPQASLQTSVPTAATLGEAAAAVPPLSGHQNPAGFRTLPRLSGRGTLLRPHQPDTLPHHIATRAQACTMVPPLLLTVGLGTVGPTPRAPLDLVRSTHRMHHRMLELVVSGLVDLMPGKHHTADRAPIARMIMPLLRQLRLVTHLHIHNRD